jgi:site-specific DNA recombinase
VRKRAAAIDRRIAALAREAEEADDRLRRLYKLVEDGRSDVGDLLNERVAELKATRAKAHAALERARSARETVRDNRPILIERFTRIMRERLSTGPVPARKALLGSLVDRIEVDDRAVRSVGRKEALEHAIVASGQGGGVFQGFVPKWRSRQGLNPQPPRSKRGTLSS